MVRKIVENQDEKVIEAFTMMSDKNDVAEFKDVFKGKFDQDWNKIAEALKDEEEVDGKAPEEKYLEDIFKANRDKIES